MTDILYGDALERLKDLPSESINCCVTSPPYYNLRNYAVTGQIGLEDTPEEYIEKLVRVFREVRRVLRKDGTLWLNIADTYAKSGKGINRNGMHSTDISKSSDYLRKTDSIFPAKCDGYKRKDMIGIPWMLALALRNDGWYLRQDIIWYKPNCMPESVKDRFTKSHEYIFLFSKSEKYYFNHEAVKEPCVGFDKTSPRGSKGTFTPNAGRRKGNAKSFRGGGTYTRNQSFDNNTKVQRESHGNAQNEKGTRNRRSVWSVSTAQYKEAHFATFPSKLIEPCILAGCPQGGVVLDPFIGSGTTAQVSESLGCNCIGIELNAKYKPLIEKRINSLTEKHKA